MAKKKMAGPGVRRCVASSVPSASARCFQQKHLKIGQTPKGNEFVFQISIFKCFCCQFSGSVCVFFQDRLATQSLAGARFFLDGRLPSDVSGASYQQVSIDSWGSPDVGSAGNPQDGGR